MLLPADSLRAVNHDFFNQFVYCSGGKLLQIALPVGKLEEAPYIRNLSGLVLNLLFQ